MPPRAHTFVVWLKLGEFRLRSVELISDSGRPLPFVGEAVGVLLMRSGDTCTRHCYGLSRVPRGAATYPVVARHDSAVDAARLSA